MYFALIYICIYIYIYIYIYIIFLSIFPTKQGNDMLCLCTVNQVHIYIYICFVSNKVLFKVHIKFTRSSPLEIQSSPIVHPTINTS